MKAASFFCTFSCANSRPLPALASSPCLAARDFCGLAEEADQLLLSSRCLSVQGVVLESALANAALLAHPTLQASIALTTDASDVAVGAVV